MKIKTLVYLSLVTLVASLTPVAQAQRVGSSNPPRGALSVSPSGNWPQSRFDPAQTGYNPDESILSRDTIGNLVLDWQYTSLDLPENFAPAVAADNMLFFSGKWSFYVLNATTGASLWGGPFTGTAAPAVANGVVYTGSTDGHLYALNESTGNSQWHYPTGDSISASPTVVNSKVYFGSQDHYLYALDASTGELQWRFPTGVPIGTSPAVANGVVYLAADNIYALDATTGTLIWKSPISVNLSSPAVANGVLYVVSTDSFLYALNAGTGAIVWKLSMGGGQSSPAVANGSVYVGSNDRNLYAVNATTGALIWKFATVDRIQSSPAVANGIVYQGSTDKNLYAVDAKTGRALWVHWTGFQIYSSPAVANGMVYLPIGESLSAFHLPGEIPPGFSVIRARAGTGPVTLRHGVLYGITSGQNGLVVFQMVPWGDRWTFAEIAPLPFGSGGYSRLVFGPDGNPYGTTLHNYQNAGSGLVYNLTRSLVDPTAKQWRQNVLYRFQGSPDGAYPQGGDPTWDEQGNIYGTTSGGGASSNGTVYELTCSGKNCTEKVHYSFSGSPDGSDPQSEVVFDGAGNLYGTTERGGLYGYGTVFELKYSDGSWTETVLYNFTGANDGAYPRAGVIFDSSGNLYGATPDGGSEGQGTIFELSPAGDNWAFNLLYTFPFEHLGPCGPIASLTMDSAGSLYGTTLCGGLNNDGNLFKLTKAGDSWNYTSLHDFPSPESGVFPLGKLSIDANGTIYGITSSQNPHLGGPGSIWMFKQ